MIRYSATLTLAALLLTGGIAQAATPAPAATCVSPSDKAMTSLVADFEALSASRDPLRESSNGNLAALAQWPDDSTAALSAYGKALNSQMARLKAIAPASLCPEQALNQALIKDRLELELDGLRFDEARLPFNTGDGFYPRPDYAAAGDILRTDPEARAWIAKLSSLTAF